MASACWRFWALFLFFLTGVSPAMALEEGLHHILNLRLTPDRQQLEGEDRMRLPATVTGEATFHLSPRAKVTAVRSFMETGDPEAAWTPYHPVLDRFFYKGKTGGAGPTDMT